MPDAFLIRAALAGLAVALAAGPLGALVVWRRMAYFGDATAHAALLGVVLALASGLPLVLGTALVALAMGLAVTALSGRTRSSDTVIGVMSHGALAAGLVAASLVPGLRGDLQAFLFGDILAVSRADLWVIWPGALAVAGLLAWRWPGLVLATLSEDLARAAGVQPWRERLALTLALALTVAVAIKVVGALLIAAMLIVPAAAARALARSPESMALGAAGIGAAATLGGLWLSLRIDSPAGPSIVAAACAIYALALVAGALRGEG